MSSRSSTGLLGTVMPLDWSSNRPNVWRREVLVCDKWGEIMFSIGLESSIDTIQDQVSYAIPNQESCSSGSSHLQISVAFSYSNFLILREW